MKRKHARIDDKPVLGFDDEAYFEILDYEFAITTNEDEKNTYYNEKQKSGEVKVWKHSTHNIGYIHPRDSMAKIKNIKIISARDIEIKNSNNIEGKKLITRLNALRIMDYPGLGKEHTILIKYTADHQFDNNEINDFHFNHKYTITEPGFTADLHPIFNGLKPGKDGLLLSVEVINVKTRTEEIILSFLDSNVFTKGLDLAEQAVPALETVSDMVMDLGKSIVSVNYNRTIQVFTLDLSPDPSIELNHKLAKGSYIIVQTPDDPWDWTEWVYNRKSGRVVSKDNDEEQIPYNYMIISISDYTQ